MDAASGRARAFWVTSATRPRLTTWPDCGIRHGFRRHYPPDERTERDVSGPGWCRPHGYYVVDSDVSTGVVARRFDVRRRRVQQLAEQYRDTADVSQLDTPNRRVSSNGFQTGEKQRWRFDSLRRSAPPTEGGSHRLQPRGGAHLLRRAAPTLNRVGYPGDAPRYSTGCPPTARRRRSARH